MTGAPHEEPASDDAEGSTVVQSVRRCLTPRYVAFPLANVVLSVVVVLAMREEVVRAGQGGRIDVFIWPNYWAAYHLQDLPPGAVPEYTFPALLWNHVLGLAPVYVAVTIAVNAWAPPSIRTWRPTVASRGWAVVALAGGVVAAVVGLVVATFVGFEGVVFWLAAVTTGAYTCVHGVVTSVDSSAGGRGGQE